MPHTENTPLMLRAGLLSLGVHALLFGLLVVSFSWQAAPTMRVAEVELWDHLPQQSIVIKPPEVKVQIKPQQKAVEKMPQKPDLKVEQKPDIALKKAPVVEKPPKKPEKIPADSLKNLQQAMLEEDAKAMQEDLKKNKEKIDKQQEKPSAKNLAEAQAGQANAAEVDEYIIKITKQIRSHVNNQPCGNGKPEIEIAISLILTGEVVGTPKVIKGSGIPACDDAIVRAVLAKPLPVPKEAELFARFRDLKLKFRPNDGN